MTGDVHLLVEDVAAAVAELWAIERATRPAEPPPPTPRRRAPRPRSAAAVTHDLSAIEPVAYVARLAGVDIDRPGSIRCPLPGHEDRDPSFHAYAEPDRGWYCFGCHRGGSIFDLAAHLWGHPLPLRGEAFLAVKAELLAIFGPAARRVAA